MDRIPIKAHPQLFDVAFNDFQLQLGNELKWLDHIFGKAERLVKVVNGKKYFSPNIYVGADEYELITPDTTAFGNYSFFILGEPTNLMHEVGDRYELKCPFSLVVWVDMRTIELYDERNSEGVKNEILYALNNIHLKHGWFFINKIWEQAENIFKGYTMDEVDNQFLMHPYCGWRFDGEICVIQDCKKII